MTETLDPHNPITSFKAMFEAFHPRATITKARPPCEGKTPCLKIMGDYEQSKAKCLPLFNQGQHYYGYPAWLKALEDDSKLGRPTPGNGARLRGLAGGTHG